MKFLLRRTKKAFPVFIFLLHQRENTRDRLIRPARECMCILFVFGERGEVRIFVCVTFFFRWAKRIQKWESLSVCVFACSFLLLCQNRIEYIYSSLPISCNQFPILLQLIPKQPPYFQFRSPPLFFSRLCSLFLLMLLSFLSFFFYFASCWIYSFAPVIKHIAKTKPKGNLDFSHLTHKNHI